MKDYIRAAHKLHSISKSFISQVIIPQVIFFEPMYIPRALNTGTCLRQGDLCGPTQEPQPTQEKIGRGSGKNADEWTGRVEINKEELPGSKRSLYGYILTNSRLERENV